MVKKRLNQYKGRLSSSQIADGMNAAIRNAKRLAEDAEILLKGKRYSSATSLAILSIEESGKVSILRGLSVARNEKEIKECWRDYRSHLRKNVMWMLPDILKSGARKLEDFRPLFEENAEHPYLLDKIKQIGFYTDCLSDNVHWSIPEEVLDEELANTILKLAKMFLSKREVSKIEIDLWIKHLGPVWKKDMKWMQRALINWCHEMQECGLSPKSSNEMEDFIKGNIKFTEQN
jgi:AbiV family abortive infection protein